MRNFEFDEWKKLPCSKWTESHVSTWLKSIGIKEKYIQKLCEEEVTGPILLNLKRKYLSQTISMRSAQIEHLLLKRDELLMPEPTKVKKENSPQGGHNAQRNGEENSELSAVGVSTQEAQNKNEKKALQSHNPNNESHIGALPCHEYRTFCEDDKNFRYVKHKVLPPETGNDNMIVPCHEYKSLESAHKLESRKLKIKVAREVLRFACGCMNMRANGTIHFGIMDKVTGIHKHGEIIGIPVRDKEDFIDALDYIENCFKTTKQKVDARKCIRNPKFIEVIDTDDSEERFVIEYDIVPQASVVKNELYRVCIPFLDKDMKLKHEDKAFYQRIGANTLCIPDDDLVDFVHGLKEKDQLREVDELSVDQTIFVSNEDLKRNLSILLTGGTQCMDNSLFYIIVTNKFQPEHLKSIDFLVHMNIFSVFDFDPDSKTSGLCAMYKEKHAANLHFLHDYIKDLSTADLMKQLQLCDRTSWIFCNGRSDFDGGEETLDEKTWIKTKKKQLKKAVSVICNEILPKGSFVVIFLLMAEVEQPLVETFHEFYSEMSGHGYLTVISESRENYLKWSNLAKTSCSITTLNEISIVDMSWSHVNTSVQSFQLSVNRPTRCLPVIKGGLCDLKSVDEDMLHSLEIVSVDQCDDTNSEMMDEGKIKEIEQHFYQGGKIDWMNLWLADKKLCGESIQRDAFRQTNDILEGIVQSSNVKRSIESVKICHHPGSGGSTVARQILWSWRKKMRCAVVKQSNEITTVCEHALSLREYEERDKNRALPVLLLLEDCNDDYLDDVRRELGNAIATKKISSSLLCFVLLTCKRCHDPERMCRALPSQTVAVTHRLTKDEKTLFSKKLELLKLQFEPDFILTFVLMSDGFQRSYIEDFVKNLLHKIDHSSLITRLIRFVALLNSYIHDSYMSVSHCEASLGIGMLVEQIRFNRFVDSLSEEARLIFIHLRESKQISSIRIIHPLVAKEILRQLSTNLPQSTIAMELLQDKVLIEHMFAKAPFLKFIQTLFIGRNQIIKGDTEYLSIFSPLIEKVITEREGVQKAVDLLKAAYAALGKDAFVAQQLARLLYSYTRFKEALHWAEEAKSQLPYDTFVLDTLGQVYKRWFYHLHDTLEEQELEPQKVSEVINIALKGITAFRASEKAPKKETVSLNNSYYGEVDVGCRLLKLLSMVNVFATKDENSELLNYLLTDYIPEAVQKPWQKFHGLLKGLQKSMYHALECISEDLSYFQKYINEEDEELDTREPEQVHNPRKWLTRKCAVYANFFCHVSDAGTHSERITSFQRQMRAYKLGGGNIASIFYLLNDRMTDRTGKKLEEIFSMYPENPNRNDLDETELVNFLLCQVALACTWPGSSKLLTLEKLQKLCLRFSLEGKYTSSVSALFLVSILFWPATNNEEHNSANSQALMSAIDALQKPFEHKVMNVPSRNTRRTVVHFFLGKAVGLYKIVHRSAIEKQIKGTISERRLKWLGGEVWTNPEVVQLLKRVEGWTEGGHLFVRANTKGSKIRVFPRNSASLPNSNENVTFYLGFSFDGAVAFDIQVKK
ncbi:sterile alpha motif domain-containing protein 9-like isoform X3 [Hypomesus transpacificus]|uniref:sterile alpha motif domain-containing protein 9-like isoform X3 n=1 Tax=Hypomesus transpacificus TaxID=137520 RepID=UPI001F081924|nr:sterile alpha motif domain-containing protein 9-like isoform X3 [Hypomesus transpacificus]